MVRSDVHVLANYELSEGTRMLMSLKREKLIRKARNLTIITIAILFTHSQKKEITRMSKDKGFEVQTQDCATSKPKTKMPRHRHQAHPGRARARRHVTK